MEIHIQMQVRARVRRPLGNAHDKHTEGITVYKIVYSGVAKKPEVVGKCLKTLVDLGRFELPTPWLQTMCSPN